MRIFKELFYFIFLACLACSSSKLKKEKINDILIIYDETSYIKEMKKSLDFLNQFYTNPLKKISIINISKKNCGVGQVACVFPDKKASVYINPSFFKLGELEQSGTLVHEMAHHIFGYEHVSCTSKLISNKECDDGIRSAFGEELIFYKKMRQNKDFFNDAQRLIYLTKLRINSL